MAFKSLELSVIAYANGFTMWHYNTKDSIEDIRKNNKYFKDISNLCQKGDIIYITCNGITSINQITKVESKLVEISAM